MKFVVGENGRNPRKPTQTSFRPPRNPHGVTETRTRDPSGGRRAANRLRHEAAYFLYSSPNFLVIYEASSISWVIKIGHSQKINDIKSIGIHWYSHNNAFSRPVS